MATGWFRPLRSAANFDHGPVWHFAEFEHAGVLGPLPLHGPVNVARHLTVRGARAHGRQQVRLLPPEEAHLEVPVGHQPQPVARPAKVLRHGRDEGHLPLEPGHSEVLGHRVRVPAAQLVARFLQRPEARLDPPPRRLVRLHLLHRPDVPVKGHPLDEAHIQRPFPRQRHKVQHLLLVHALHHHHVQLQLPKVALALALAPGSRCIGKAPLLLGHPSCRLLRCCCR
mmetsp:Transcript_6605/g.16146  ORF Transcript_6605/g.16146 Transcript_6605/m.16146 type:complete len:226 (+) Transcript_6605:45-722(+)